jgi:V-type H+-transporting ATPase subunit a
MSLVQLIIPTEVAHDTVSELGELGNVQFKDVRPLFSKLFRDRNLRNR